MSTQRQREVAVAGLVERTETRRVAALATLAADDQATLGQFFTPSRAAALLASMADLPTSGVFRILDPGAGVGSLSVAVVARVLREVPNLTVDLVVIELDEVVLPWLRETLADIESTCSALGVAVSTRLLHGDFVSMCTDPFDARDVLEARFDLVLMNPPYKKLNVSDQARRALEGHGVDCPNIYAAFMALGADLLKPDGQLVSITPRSFANGTYFDQFRRYLLGRIVITRLHVFESRSTVFSDTGVLQENVILAGRRGAVPGKVALSVSHGHTDEPTHRYVEHDEVVHPGDPQQFIRILSDDAASAVADRMELMPCLLNDLGLQVSTGRVVDFRSRECLTEATAPGAVPMVYANNLRGGAVHWPGDVKKSQGFVPHVPKDVSLLLPPGDYVIVKRFSAKEERRRVVAAVWLCEQSPEPLALDNKLNYFHVKNQGLDREVAVGLSFWLNSSLVDAYFRTFSGHTQVNAGDLKSLRYPDLDTLRAIGRRRLLPDLPDQAEIDAEVERALATRGLAA